MCYTTCYTLSMPTITHRELRNNSAEVLRRVAAGEAMEVTNRGVVVAHLSPVATPSLPFPVSRPARRIGGWSKLPRVKLGRSVAEIIEDEREDR
jgi:prevent-host-death family protein